MVFFPQDRILRGMTGYGGTGRGPARIPQVEKRIFFLLGHPGEELE